MYLIATQELETIKKQYIKIADAYGCLGVLQVNVGETSVQYLVMVTGCFSVGKICEAEIFRVTQTQFISLQFQSTAEEKIAEVCNLIQNLECGIILRIYKNYLGNANI